MKTFQFFITAFSLIAAAQAWGPGWNGTYVTTTITTDIYTTYCPAPTTFHYGTKTYTATESETITITDCPCTYVTSIPKPTPTPVPHSYISPPAGNNTGVPPPTSWIPPVYVTTTETVSTYTTYCPVPTTVVQGTKTYTVTEATTLTITDCPCTHVTSVPAPSSEYTTKTFSTLTTYCPESTTITHEGQTYPVSTPGTVTIPIVSVSPVAPSTPVVAPTTAAGTTYVPTNVPVGPSATTSGPIQVSNPAVKNVGGFGGALAAAGLAILL